MDVYRSSLTWISGFISLSLLVGCGRATEFSSIDRKVNANNIDVVDGEGTQTPPSENNPPTTGGGSGPGTGGGNGSNPPNPSLQPPMPSLQPPAPSIQPPAPSTQPPTPSTQPPAPSQGPGNGGGGGHNPPTPSQQPPAPSTQPPAPSQQPPAPSVQPPVPSTQPPTPSVQPPAPSQGPGNGGGGGHNPPTPSQQPPAPSTQPPAPSQQPPAPSVQPPIPSQGPGDGGSCQDDDDDDQDQEELADNDEDCGEENPPVNPPVNPPPGDSLVVRVVAIEIKGFIVHDESIHGGRGLHSCTGQHRPERNDEYEVRGGAHHFKVRYQTNLEIDLLKLSTQGVPIDLDPHVRSALGDHEIRIKSVRLFLAGRHAVMLSANGAKTDVKIPSARLKFGYPKHTQPRISQELSTGLKYTMLGELRRVRWSHHRNLLIINPSLHRILEFRDR